MGLENPGLVNTTVSSITTPASPSLSDPSTRTLFSDTKPNVSFMQQLGPGQYHCISALSSTGTYFNSGYRGSGCGRIGKASRFEEERTLPPGPGKYNHGLDINRMGKYSSYKIPSNFVKSFRELTGRPSTTSARLRGQALTMCFGSLRLEINHFKDDSNK